jgi:hypothetical protein
MRFFRQIEVTGFTTASQPSAGKPARHKTVLGFGFSWHCGKPHLREIS